MTFKELNLIEPIMHAVAEKGYVTPTPIQEQAIPPALERRDLMGCAQTGTGKTAAFTLPILQLLSARPRTKGRRPIKALVLTPTRELALQIDECCRDYARYTDLRHCVIFGGVNQRPQVDALQRGIDLLDTQPDIVDSPEVEAEYGTAFAPRRGNWPPIAGGVEFRDVTFAYKTGETVLRDFNLKVEPGQTIALVGETGAGKSTIVNLVCRFYEPTAGQVLIDGVDYRERSQLWLHSALGYVLQTPHLFSGSIADNIRYGRKDATLDEVKRAAAMVRADRFIEALPDGYGTEVGEGGGRLSTGQKQLVCFARVVLSDPRIFVLDEATSSIDTETEQLIQNAIQTVLTGRTSFIVAHRLSTIRSADKILVIRGGRITEAGTHDELLALGGYYYSLYTHQYRAEATRNAFEA